MTVEDAFLRSVLPGRDCSAIGRRGPVGLMIDPLGLHFDPSQPSLIETLVLSPRAAALEAIAHPALRVSCANFLSVAPEPIYDAVVMNPPFEGTHCLDHVRHAYDFLSENGSLIAILPASAQVGSTGKHERFQAWAESKRERYGRLWTDLPPESERETLEDEGRIAALEAERQEQERLKAEARAQAEAEAAAKAAAAVASQGKA